MNYSLFVARRLLTPNKKGRKLSGPVVAVATAAIALGIGVMIVAVAVGFGFKEQIREKLAGFGSHVQVTSMDFNQSFETNPIHQDSALVRQLLEIQGVRHVQPYVLKPGIIKTSDAFQGMALKGIDSEFDTLFISSNLEQGHMLHLTDTLKSSGIVLSRATADRLHLNLGDAVRMYFVQNGIRARRFTLEGIFNSHFSEYDNKLAYVDMRHLVQINGWQSDEVSGYEVLMRDFDSLDYAAEQISFVTSSYIGPGNSFLRAQSIRQTQSQMFGWLNLLDTNMLVILVLIMAVAILNMISGLLILILENTNTIGLLKAMGCRNAKIRQIFIFMALKIIGKGMIIGNVIGLTICVVQHFTGAVRLDPENYYLDTVPVSLHVHIWLILNAVTLAVTTLSLLGPSYIVERIKPAKSIRFN